MPWRSSGSAFIARLLSRCRWCTTLSQQQCEYQEYRGQAAYLTGPGETSMLLWPANLNWSGAMTINSERVLDNVGWKLLALLQEDARRSFSELGRAVGLSSPAVAE